MLQTSTPISKEYVHIDAGSIQFLYIKPTVDFKMSTNETVVTYMICKQSIPVCLGLLLT